MRRSSSRPISIITRILKGEDLNMWPFTRRKKIQQTPSSPITERIVQNARDRSSGATPSSTPNWLRIDPDLFEH
jgi:hypothetical protein